ncbi:MAG TPA: hypothetical protein VKA36_10850 [Solirubrobacterales bacterium]|nr:hypothetical protein [Solirubrobacterales bacterium]
MTRTAAKLLLIALALFSLGALAACGNEEEELHTEEGEPLELGELRYNVQITRFLNPDSVEDAAYLRGEPPPPAGKDYLAVFIRIQNEGEEGERIPLTFPVKNGREEEFQALPIDNPFALDLGTEIPAGGQLPAIDSPAASGTIKGSMLLYLIDEAATENRPLELEIDAPDGETGTIELDI